MSRIGAMPIEIPEGVKIDVHDGGSVTVVGKGGKTSAFVLCHGIKAVLDGNALLLVNEKQSSPRAKVMWGSYRSNINSAIEGLSKGFSVELEVSGVGYRVVCDDKYLSMFVGFSHGVKYVIPEGIEIKCPKPSQLVVRGSDKVKVHMVAADICSIRRYDPYKGKGISVKGEYVYRKEVSKKK
ncbi:50S ribosomal protein L6 [Anaplasma capra]|uniref:50S ribosomal protein L6 n=1 Tax=Anaplasma capra TaxID=1562740 RepID=UPI0021D60AD2|nr:50S ribosomal protein L6 [Anaplasma capra]MCU7611927.1 50S ribosomal protein L6 [Anaplasma capra]MCU7612793.1 50S ribosomal protein L6 [Anaplasma capra]